MLAVLLLLGSLDVRAMLPQDNRCTVNVQFPGRKGTTQFAAHPLKFDVSTGGQVIKLNDGEILRVVGRPGQENKVMVTHFKSENSAPSAPGVVTKLERRCLDAITYEKKLGEQQADAKVCSAQDRTIIQRGGKDYFVEHGTEDDEVVEITESSNRLVICNGLKAPAQCWSPDNISLKYGVGFKVFNVKANVQPASVGASFSATADVVHGDPVEINCPADHNPSSPAVNTSTIIKDKGGASGGNTLGGESGGAKKQ